jgi:hypothetical protein
MPMPNQKEYKSNRNRYQVLVLVHYLKVLTLCKKITSNSDFTSRRLLEQIELCGAGISIGRTFSLTFRIKKLDIFLIALSRLLVQSGNSVNFARMAAYLHVAGC